MDFVFNSPHKQPYAELKRELEELEARRDSWSPVDVARYCLLQDAMQERRRDFRKTIKVVDGDKEQ